MDTEQLDFGRSQFLVSSEKMNLANHGAHRWQLTCRVWHASNAPSYEPVSHDFGWTACMGRRPIVPFHKDNTHTRFFVSVPSTGKVIPLLFFLFVLFLFLGSLLPVQSSNCTVLLQCTTASNISSAQSPRNHLAITSQSRKSRVCTSPSTLSPSPKLNVATHRSPPCSTGTFRQNRCIVEHCKLLMFSVAPTQITN